MGKVIKRNLLGIEISVIDEVSLVEDHNGQQHHHQCAKAQQKHPQILTLAILLDQKQVLFDHKSLQ